jgi:hypothetical protein
MLLESELGIFFLYVCTLFHCSANYSSRALANVQAHLGTQAAPAPAAESMEVDAQESGLPAEAIEKINATSER